MGTAGGTSEAEGAAEVCDGASEVDVVEATKVFRRGGLLHAGDASGGLCSRGDPPRRGCDT